MTAAKGKRTVNEALILLIGSFLAVFFPLIIVPAAILLAATGITHNKLRQGNPQSAGIIDLILRGQIVVTTRVILLLLFGTLPLMLVSSHYIAVAVVIGYNLIIAILVLLDIHISPRPENLTIERRVASKLSIGRDNQIELLITNHSHKPIEMILNDEFPEAFEGSARNIVIRVEKRTSATYRYSVKPMKRGRYFFNQTAVKFRGILELVVFFESYGEGSKVEVYPDITGLSRFNLQMRRGNQTETGLITERKRGSGSDFESLREYVKGDEFRKIDWKASARKNKLISREFQSEVNQSIIVAIDCSRAMGAMSDGMTLLDHAVNSALILGYQVMKKGDKIGLITFSDKPTVFLAPGRGKTHFYSFLKYLHALEADRVEPDYDAVLRYISSLRLRRSLLIFITDLTSGEAVQKMFNSISLVSKKHLPVVVSVIDPELKKTADNLPDSSEQVFQKVAARKVIEKVSSLSKRVEKLGVASVMTTPDQLNSSLLSSYLKIKLRGRL